MSVPSQWDYVRYVPIGNINLYVPIDNINLYVPIDNINLYVQIDNINFPKLSIALEKKVLCIHLFTLKSRYPSHTPPFCLSPTLLKARVIMGRV